ncbi:MAG TPA: TetR/AcrR family transcriptional regulator [Candidatus Limnocylindrales bacterium]|nr:TetR/AcrR family transcriptional regulator [Candidatus Limnocylindrales bacterium]
MSKVHNKEMPPATAPADDASPSTEVPPASAARRPRGRPRQVPLEEQRETILSTATRLFATDGFDGVTSERIAEASGVGRPTVYQLFGSKNDVFIAAIDRAFARILTHVRRSFGTTVNLRGRKQAVANITAYFEIVTQEPDTFTMLLLADRSGDAPTREAAKVIRRRMQDAVAAYMRATWEGFQDLTERDAQLAATLIASAVETSAVYHLERPDRTTPEIVQFVADFVWAGIYDLAVGHDIPMGRKGTARKPV